MEETLAKTRVLLVNGCDNCGQRLSAVPTEMTEEAIAENKSSDPDNFYVSKDAKHNTTYTQWTGQSRCRFC